MTRTTDPKPASRFLVLGSVFVVVASLYLAQEVLIPIALAVLFSFLLAPLVRLLERVRLPRVAAVLLSVLLAFGVVAGVGFVVYNQLADLTPRLHGYGENVKAKVANLSGSGGMFEWFHHAQAEVKQVLAVPASQPAASRPAASPGNPTSPSSSSSSANAIGAAAGQALGGAAAAPPPPTNVQRVEVVNQQQASEVSPLAVVRTVAADVLGRAGTAFIIIVFTIFMLLQREDLRDRVIRLVGRDRLTTTTEALDDAAGRVSRYLILQSIVNGTVGVIIAGLLWATGRVAGTPFPSPALWGLLSGLMRFIPYVGIWMSALLPVLLSLAVFASFKWTFVTFGVYLATELITANAVEPMLFGSSTGLGSLAVLVAAAFWTWLWGPVGLLLSTPLTVCLVVMGKYVPALGFLNIMLSDEPALNPPDRVYQRLLALDQEEAADLIHEYAKAMPLEQLYDEVVLPALALAEGDVHHGGLTGERRDAIRTGLAEIVDELGDRATADATRAASRAAVDAAKGGGGNADAAAAVKGSLAVAPDRLHLPQGCVMNVVCLPAHDDSDQLAAVILGQLLKLRGFCVTVLSPHRLASEMVAAVEAARPTPSSSRPCPRPPSPTPATCASGCTGPPLTWTWSSACGPPPATPSGPATASPATAPSAWPPRCGPPSSSCTR